MDNIKYKMVCIDLDGTLLTDDKIITEENMAAIKEADLAGVTVCISTGRILKFVDHIRDLLEIDIPIIASNGAIISAYNTSFENNYLNKNQILRLIEIANNYDVDIYLNTRDSIIAEKVIPESYSYKQINSRLEDRYKVSILENQSFQSIVLNKIVKAICINNNSVSEVEKIYKHLDSIGLFEISSAEYNYCEINNKGVSKGEAVEKLAKELGLNMYEVMCIGDGGNDIEMLKKAGLSVAMDNAMESVKEICDYVTESNNNSGVAKAIRKFILI